MKTLITISLFILPSACFAAPFSLDSVQSIECKDPNASDVMNVFFTTTDYGASAYQRRSGSIPYDFANNDSQTNQTGQMSLNNDPNADGGKISLIDASNPSSVGTILLTPTAQAHEYTGALSGDVYDIYGETVTLKAYPLHCVIK